ncbi:MAG: hypothetical protein EB084_10970 [Proteobacteria bacterium]|nr:hypothetical protein [Pseudomonadota bacterium]
MELPRICEAPLQTEAKGVCFFDVDGTLTQGEFGKSRVRPPVEACIAAGWDVGVATASGTAALTERRDAALREAG